MARLVLTALALTVALTVAARAHDYAGGGGGGVRMPQYADYDDGTLAHAHAHALSDYRGHSPDAPSHLDYKYEEQPSDHTDKQINDNDEADLQEKFSKKERREREEQAPSEFRVRSSDGTGALGVARRHRGSRHRARRGPALQEEPRRRRRPRLPRRRSLDHTDIVDYHNSDAHSQMLDDDLDSITKGKASGIIRRKPRDRLFVKPRREEMDSDEEVDPDRKVESDVRRRQQGAPAPGSATTPDLADGGEGALPALDEEDYDRELVTKGRDRVTGRGRHGHGRPREYQDYYDMNKADAALHDNLPKLLRRTTTSTSPPPTLPAPAGVFSSTDLLAALWTARRTHSRRPVAASAPVTELATTTPAPLTASSATQPHTSHSETSKSMELSLAEMSRLSILKKAHKKESTNKGSMSGKPPVLMQVTSRVPTVVMVEPATEDGEPWMRARAVPDETPARLDHVKRLMRQKLVARARSIADLTDNWDDLVCDYIDVSLLDATSAPSTAAPCSAAAPALLLLLLLLLHSHLLIYVTS